jgi:hypothetical protein
LRHEAFAQLIAQAPKRGMSNAQCYREAGYRVVPGPACDVAASRLLSSDKVKARIDELIAPTVKKTRTTVDTLAEQLDQVFAGATGDRQWGAAGSAAALKAKLLGFMREKIEIGSAGQFDACETVQDAVRLLLEQEPAAELLPMIDQLREEIVRAAADRAQVIEVVAPARPVPGGETERSLQLFRPKRLRR